MTQEEIRAITAKAVPSLWVNCITKEVTFNPNTVDIWLKYGHSVNAYFTHPAIEPAQDEKLRVALENCRLLAARHRKESWALLILGFCSEGGVAGSPLRDGGSK